MFKKAMLLIVVACFSFSCAKKKDEGSSGDELNNNQVYKLGEDIFSEKTGTISDRQSLMGLWTTPESIASKNVTIDIRIRFAPKRIVVAVKCSYTKEGKPDGVIYASAVTTAVEYNDANKSFTISGRSHGEVSNSDKKCDATINSGVIEYSIDPETNLLCLKNKTSGQTDCEVLQKIND